MKRIVSLPFTFLFLAASPALAHTGGSHASGLVSGLLHPLFGTDHVLAMIAIGLLAFQSTGYRKPLTPLLFILMMGLGAVAGLLQMGFPFAEQGILGSVILLGAALAFGKHIHPAILLPFVALFGISHGFAHGVEMPSAASAALYFSGFLAATALLIGAGYVAGETMTKLSRSLSSKLIRAAGLVISLSGFGLALT